MLRFDQEGDVGPVEDFEGGQAWVEQGQGVVGDDCFRHWWRGIDAVEVDTEKLEEEKENAEEKVSSLPQHF